jgi:tripartite motif-containing protein 71
MRSKSDHRLASQFRQQEEQYYSRGGNGEADGRVSPLQGRKFGERPQPGRGRRESEYEDFDDSSRPSRYRSRFTRHLDNPDEDRDSTTGRSVRFCEESPSQAVIPRKERERVLDTEDVAKGPLSGITRLYDSPRVMKRIQETELRLKKEKEPKPPQAAAVNIIQGAKPVAAAAAPAKKTSRQVSEEDEISKIKRQNKTAEASTAAATAESRPAVASVKEETRSTPATTRRPSEVRDDVVE